MVVTEQPTEPLTALDRAVTNGVLVWRGEEDDMVNRLDLDAAIETQGLEERLPELAVPNESGAPRTPGSKNGAFDGRVLPSE